MAKEKEGKEVKEKVEEEKFVLQEIPTQTMTVIVDRETGKTYDIYSILCKIANDLEELKKLL